MWLHDLAERAGHPAGAHHFALWSLGRRAKSNAKSHGKLWKVMGRHMHWPYAGGLSAPASKGKATSRGSFAAGGAEPEAVEISIYVMSIGCRRMSFVLGFGASISQTYS